MNLDHDHDLDRDLVAVQRRTVRVLISGQILGGLAIGATLSIGSVLAADISGSDAWAGAAATMTTLGAAIAALPLARLAQERGRRFSLTTGVLTAAFGAMVTIASAQASSFPLLLLGFVLLGSGSAVGLQSRFAATDVASPKHRGRDLSVVVWSATIGAVVGPNLFGPGEVIAGWFNMPPLTGSFVIAIVAQVLAAIVFLVGLRPDPLLISRTLPVPATSTAQGGIEAKARLVFAITAIGLSHAVMVGIMSMTPVHMKNHGDSLTIIGLTISIHIAGMYALSPVFGWLSDRVGRVATILFGQALFAVALVTLGLGAANATLVMVGLTFLGLGWSASTVAGSALVADLVTGAARTRVQGRTDLVMNLSGAIGGAAAGPVLALLGYSGLAWAASVLVLVVAVGALANRAHVPAEA
ncbi:MFS transporter [Cryobacterium psychrophilum]|uniref:MFS transporter n=1 Tax=Cryobacterium psychrophilum TaxID=41988 RepID=A0A4Y8KP44_9MICO|nr:MFS transporter [Cryobacterium psychrophilum]TDW30570.1 putative MFS family arabinose efflux permease [Cryobacterium psychrophilum]TFD80213.1 MFS transporter [Cryobacterium psychrophilum]